MSSQFGKQGKFVRITYTILVRDNIEMIKKFRVLSFAVIVLATACIPTASSLTSSPTEESVPEVFSTLEPILTISNTSAPAATSTKPIQTSSPTGTPTQTIQMQCPSMVSLEDIEVSNVVVLQPLSPITTPYLLDIETGEASYLPYSDDHALSDLEVSPDWKWIAYLASPYGSNDLDATIVVSDRNGEIIYSSLLNIEQGWFAIDIWLNHEQILLESYVLSPDLGILEFPLPVSILNPFSGEIHNLDSDYPDLLPYFEPSASWDAFGKSGTGYDPTLNYVAYARLNAVNGLENIALWDRQSAQEIISIQAAEAFGNGPLWSPDGMQFITDSLVRIPPGPRGPGYVAIPEELFSINLFGEITRLTYLSETFEQVSIAGYRWSPDGGRIAYWVITQPEIKEFGSSVSRNHLAIADIQSKQTRLFCINGMSYIEPIWSPDGEQLLVAIINDKGSDNTGSPVLDTYLIDIRSNVMARIAVETIPLAWMISP